METLNNIQNIIFDLGNVLLDVDPRKTMQAFNEIGIENPESSYLQAHEKKLFLSLETGIITPDEFRKLIMPHTVEGTTENEIDIAWNAMLLDFPDAKLRLLRKLKKTHTLYLLSNTNEIHHQSYSRQYPGIFDPENSTLFKKCYYSHLLHMRKPDEEIFQFVMDDAGIQPGESLFIDDMEANVQTAKAMGFRTIHLTKEKELTELL